METIILIYLAGKPKNTGRYREWAQAKGHMTDWLWRLFLGQVDTEIPESSDFLT